MLAVSDQRAEPRGSIVSRVEVRWQDPIGTNRVSAALLEDKSSHGACIRVRQPIATGIKLQVVGPRQDFTGTTRYCHRNELGYVIGIQRDPQDS